MSTAAQMHRDRMEDARADRLASIRRAVDYYENRPAPAFRLEPGEIDDHTPTNVCRLVVDKGTSLLFGKPLTWQVDETGTTDTPVEQYLADIWRQNNQQALLHNLAQHGFLAGCGFIKIDPRPAGIRLIPLDPATVELACESEDVSDVYQYTIEYTVSDRNGDELQKRQTITRDEQGATWEIANFQRRPGKGERWQLVGAVETWPYAWAPIVHCQNLPNAAAVWGYGDLEDVIPLQDALNQAISNIRRVLRLHGFPQTIVTGASIKQMERGPNKTIGFPSEQAKVFNLEMFTDLAAAREHYHNLRAAIFSLARMTDLSTFAGNLGALTNFGLRVLFADALEKTETKRVLYGGLIVELNRRLAELGGYGPNVITTLAWPDPLPLNVMELAGEARIKQALGFISDESLSEQLGYAYEDELIRIKQQIARGAVNPNAANMPTPPVAANEPLKQ